MSSKATLLAAIVCCSTTLAERDLAVLGDDAGPARAAEIRRHATAGGRRVQAIDCTIPQCNSKSWGDGPGGLRALRTRYARKGVEWATFDSCRMESELVSVKKPDAVLELSGASFCRERCRVTYPTPPALAGAYGVEGSTSELRDVMTVWRDETGKCEPQSTFEVPAKSQPVREIDCTTPKCDSLAWGPRHKLRTRFTTKRVRWVTFDSCRMKSTTVQDKVSPTVMELSGKSFCQEQCRMTYQSPYGGVYTLQGTTVWRDETGKCETEITFGTQFKNPDAWETFLGHQI